MTLSKIRSPSLVPLLEETEERDSEEQSPKKKVASKPKKKAANE